MPAEDLEFYDLVGDTLLSMGKTYGELNQKGPIQIKIDGQEVSIHPLKARYDPNDKDVFAWRSTIYDAAQQLYAVQHQEAVPIPILCHQQHMKPVGVCRACLVEVSQMVRSGRPTTTLAPACYLPVTPGMEIKTLKTSESVAKIVRSVIELLLSDYRAPAKIPGIEQPVNELERIAALVQARPNRYPSHEAKPAVDDSSLLIQVDHQACILCDRCVRACSDIRNNYVIGRMGKGYETRIAFDNDLPMGESSCVACGECMISCPTGALMNKQKLNIDSDIPSAEIEIEISSDDPGLRMNAPKEVTS